MTISADSPSQGVSSTANHLPLDVIRKILEYLASPLDVDQPGKFPWYLGYISTAYNKQVRQLTNRSPNDYVGEMESSFAQLSLVRLMTQSTCWKDATLELDVPEVELLGVVKGRLPLLESLTLLTPSYDSEPVQEVPDAFEDVPSLRNLT
ncbi:hypothetical protein AX15_006571 [Amanita polypyramis BW_CC]|nr:hypothetical protein AX15_006571 [Amanita polypyramis BW_CC]